MIGGTDFNQQWVIGSTQAADTINNLARIRPNATGTVKPVSIASMIGGRMQELVNQVTVRRVQLHSIKTGLPGSPSALSKRRDQLLDVPLG